jgi:hypothetical protein
MQAGRMVQGTATIPERGDVRLEASVVQASGEVSAPGAATGRFRDLLKMEKTLIVDLSARLGYQLSEAERLRVLENGTQNLAAFLAYSRGLLAEDAGDFSRAAAYFSDAVQTDPGFQAAKEQYQSASVATDVQQAQPSQVTTVAATPPPQPPVAEPVTSALSTTIGNVASNLSDQTTPGGDQSTGGNSASTPAGNPNPTVTSQGVTTTVTGTIRIVFRLP